MMMVRLRAIALGAVGILLAAVLLLVALDWWEVGGMLLLTFAPARMREAYFLRFRNPAGQEVYLLGTIHGRHLTTEDYSLLHLQAVLHHLRPDLLLVESRSEELARDNWGDGPVEMPFAGLTALSHYIQKRIALDRETLQRVADPWWRERIADAIAFRQALLDTIAAVGEQQPCAFNDREPSQECDESALGEGWCTC